MDYSTAPSRRKCHYVLCFRVFFLGKIMYLSVISTEEAEEAGHDMPISR